VSTLLFVAAALCGLLGALTVGWVLLGVGVVAVVLEMLA
jgi:hypothetical protein